MDEKKLLRIDGIKWLIEEGDFSRSAIPLCAKHSLKLKPIYPSHGYRHDHRVFLLTCAECEENLKLPRSFEAEKEYVFDKIDSKAFKSMKVINLDDEAIPITVERASGKEDPQFWAEARIVRTKSGVQLVLYAGDKTKKNKTQIFIDPDLHRVGFDHNDAHPGEVFLKIEAMFDDRSTAAMSGPVNSPSK